ncbi:MAG TPA: hypothetical protein VMX16_15005 [Terriglobia bacterium]|nr:hypothetical protein [Terriglobia bacterium]
MTHFKNAHLGVRVALCELLLARLDLAVGNPEAARLHCDAALKWLATSEAPAVAFQAFAIQGQIFEGRGAADAAFKAYQRAHAKLEGLRSQLAGEELKIAFLRDKLTVYESLVILTLQRGTQPKTLERAFDFIERAKSRSFADLIAFQLSVLRPRVKKTRNWRRE